MNEIPVRETGRKLTALLLNIPWNIRDAQMFADICCESSGRMVYLVEVRDDQILVKWKETRVYEMNGVFVLAVSGSWSRIEKWHHVFYCLRYYCGGSIADNFRNFISREPFPTTNITVAAKYAAYLEGR